MTIDKADSIGAIKPYADGCAQSFQVYGLWPIRCATRIVGAGGMDDRGTTIITALIAGVVGALGVAGAALASGWFSFASKDEELRVHLVEIAIGILRADPKEDVTPARGWAIEVIEKNSGVKFTETDRAALLHKPIVSTGWIADFTKSYKDKDILPDDL